MNPSATNTDPGGAGEWALDDQVVQLREWGTDRVYRLPPAPIDEWTIGSSSRCSLQLRDPPRYISRLHARLVRTYGTWFIHDAGSKNGLWQDNARRPSFALTPGLEIGIGSLLLVAESPRSIVLRGFVARMLGWDLHRLSDIDRALRALRTMATMRAPLLLCGEGNLVDLARQLHALTLGAAAPFVVSD
ncbi:MAG: FHA domain-containing protein, partial [Kofleriaceae bacterium]